MQTLDSNIKLVYEVVNSLEFIPEKVAKEDLEQIGLIALWKATVSYNEEESKVAFSTHAYGLIKRDILDYCRMQTAKKRKDVIVEDRVEEVEDEVMSTLLISKICEILPKDYSDVFISRYVDGMEYQEIMDAYGYTKRQVQYRLDKSRDTLKKELKWEE